MEQKLKKQFCKRCLCAVLTVVLTVSLLVSGNLPVRAEKRESQLELVKGGTKFFENVEAGSCSTTNPEIINVVASIQRKRLLFDRQADATNSFSGFSSTPNEEMDLSAAEFVVQRVGEYYTMYNQSEGVYLMNGGSSAYFGSMAITHTLDRVEHEDGTYSFEIKRTGNGNLDGRYVYF